MFFKTKTKYKNLQFFTVKTSRKNHFSFTITTTQKAGNKRAFFDA